MKRDLVKISAPKAKNKNQLAYEMLIQNIEGQKLLIANVKKGLSKAYAKIETEIKPLVKEQDILMREYIIRLDNLVEEIGLGKLNREWFDSYMHNEVEILLESFGFQDKKVVGLYEKYSLTPLDDLINSEESKATAASLSELLGFEVDMNEVLEKGETQFMLDHQEEIQKNLHQRMHSESAESSFNTNSSKKKTASQTARQKKIDEEKKILAKDARSIYMRLIKKMHPDLERDAVQKNIKTEVVKKITEAYHANDFFNLLKLQIEHLEEGEIEAENLADDMLKRYNKILKGQLEETKALINQEHFTHGSVIQDFLDKNGKFSASKFNSQYASYKNHITHIQQELTASYRKPKTWFKSTIKDIKQQQQEKMMEDAFYNMFANVKF